MMSICKPKRILFFKKIQKKRGMRIGTHNGVFHADEALAIAMLQRVFPVTEIIRTRDVSVLKTLDLLCDVGAEFDASRLRFDHHQRGFQTYFGDRRNTVLSSAGLIYSFYGQKAIESVLKERNAARTISEDEMQRLYNTVYVRFIEVRHKCFFSFFFPFFSVLPLKLRYS